MCILKLQFKIKMHTLLHNYLIISPYYNGSVPKLKLLYYRAVICAYYKYVLVFLRIIKVSIHLYTYI